MRVQLWSYNYDPEPTGIGPMARVWVDALRELGHEIDVVAAHPHYPTPSWGQRLWYQREVRDGIPVLRLPLWIGRASSAERFRQELTFMAAELAALPSLGRPDVMVVGSPSFPGLVPAIVNARVRRVPWVLWLHDILPDGATSVGLVKDGLVLGLSKRLEQAAYAAATAIVVPSESFVTNLRTKGVPEKKLRLVPYPATRDPRSRPVGNRRSPTPRLLAIGNIGHTQGLAPLVRAFETAACLADVDVRLVITGDGVASDDVRAEIRTDRVEMLGLVDDDRLERELERATLALVTQRYAGAEFNIPSKMMNYMAYGVPILAAVFPRGEVARIINESQAGWVVDSGRPESFAAKVAELIGRPAELARRGRAGERYAREHFSRRAFATRFDDLLLAARRATEPDQPNTPGRSTSEPD